MTMIEKTKLNSIYGIFANQPYRNKELEYKELEYIKNDELALKEAMEKRGKPNGNINKI